MYFDFPYSSPESLEGRDFLTATFLVSGIDPSQIIKRAGSFAIGQTIGTWLELPGITREMIETYQARVVGLYAVPQLENSLPYYILQVAFPSANVNDSFGIMLAALVGNDVSTSLSLRLLDLSFTSEALKHYTGPKQGVEGVRNYLNVYDRPLLLNMLKPSIGMSPVEAAKLFFEVGLGGVDIVKDDEVLSSVPVSGVLQRVREFNKVAEKVFAETGNKVLYIPNISSSPKKMEETVKVILDEGTKAVMVNFVATGLDALREVSDAYGDQLMILGHYAGVGAMQSELGGIAPSVMIGTLGRLAGADMIMTMFAQKSDPIGYYNFIQTVQKQTLPLGKIKPVLATVGGGLSPLNVGALIQEVGNDIVLGVGGAIQGHPMGAQEGAKAVRAAMASAVSGTNLDEAAKSSPALKKAIETWGAKQ